MTRKFYLFLLIFSSFELFFCQDSWISDNSPSYSNQLHSIAFHTATLTEDKKILFFGGMTREYQNLESIFEYDLILRKWIVLPKANGTIPSGRDEHTAILTKYNTILIYGGQNLSGEVFPDLFEYNISSNTWNEIIQISFHSPRYSHTAIYTKDNCMIIFGGANTRGIPLSDTFQFNLTSRIWSSLQTLDPKFARSSHTAIYVKKTNSMLIFGGAQNDFTFSDVWKYSLDLNTWTFLEVSGSIPLGRYGHSAVYTNDNMMIIFGGSVGNYSSFAFTSYSNSIYAFNISTNQWSVVQESKGGIPDPRAHHSALYTPDNTLIIAGGLNQNGITFNEIFQYSIRNNTWSILGANPRYFHSAVYVPNRNWMIVYGGFDGGVALSDYLVLDLVTNSWIPTNNSETFDGRCGHSAVYYEKEDIMVVYGGYSPSTIFDEVLVYYVSLERWNFVLINLVPEMKFFHSVILFDDSMLVFGGMDDTINPVNKLYEYNIPLKIWTEISSSGDIPRERYLHSAIYESANKCMYIFGGLTSENFASIPSNQIYKYDIVNKNWIHVNASGSIPNPRSKHSAIYTLTGFMIIFGGLSSLSELYFNDIKPFSISNNTWLPFTLGSGILPGPRAGHSVIYTKDSRMIVFGGTDRVSSFGDVAIYKINLPPVVPAIYPLDEPFWVKYMIPISIGVVAAFFLVTAITVTAWYRANRKYRIDTDISKLDGIRKGKLLLRQVGTERELYLGSWQKHEVVLKLLQKSELENLLSRSKLALKINHPTIVHIYGIWNTLEKVGENMVSKDYLVMEYFPEGNIKDFIENKRSLIKEKHLIQLLFLILNSSHDIACGMLCLFKNAFFHGNLKRENVLIQAANQNYVAKISDFGILSTDISLRAPEHIQKPQFSFEADIWAYGCLLFQIFSYGDEELYSSTNEEEIKEAIRKGNFPKPKQVWPQVIQKIITECLNINPYARITFDKIVIDLGNTKMKEPLPLSNQRNSLIELPTKA